MSNRKKVVPEVTNDELIQAALNTPDENVVTLGDKKFVLKDFKYKDYIAFIKYLAPMFDTFLGTNTRGFEHKGSGLNALAIIDFCENDLPKMALIVANNTFPEMTEEELVETIPSPFDIAELVLAQMAHNKIIEKLSGFLQLMTPRTT